MILSTLRETQMALATREVVLRVVSTSGKRESSISFAPAMRWTDMESTDASLPSKPTKPSLLFESITFSDGTTLDIGDNDIVVFVGPNNAGKSAALRELEGWVAHHNAGNVIHDAKVRKEGNSEDLLTYLLQHAQQTGGASNLSYAGLNYSIHSSHVQFFDQKINAHVVAPFFVKRVATETRIRDANPAPSLALHTAPPTHPIHLLLMDEDLAFDISQKFKRAFGEDLTVFRAGGSYFPLYVGPKPPVPAGKDELSREFVEELQRTNVPLEQQGDGMRSFAAVLLNVLVSKTHSIQFLDEPEAFLHPPQARLLGRYIAESRREKSQLFIATHSADILDGLIEGGLDNVRIVRLRRDETVNRVKELGKEQTSAIAKDTLTRFSHVFDGIFFEHVVICEFDADCMLYQSVLELPSISGDRKPDALFVHTSGKHRMAKLADTLKSLDVPITVIADIDILNDENVFRNLVESLGGRWEDVESRFKAVAAAVVRGKPPINATQIATMIRDELSSVIGIGDFPKEKTNAIKKILNTISPWSALKHAGRASLPGGDPTRLFNELILLCSSFGLWIVPVGELEGFCRSIGSHGPTFVEKVLEERSLGLDPELHDLREFIRQIWRQNRS